MTLPLRIALVFALAICYAGSTEAAAPAGQWWNASSSYRQKITITTGATAPVNRYSGYSVVRTFDTAALITASKMQADCDDLRVLWWNGTAWAELDRDISGCNTATTQVWFKLQADIADNASDDNYYIYYGNASATAGPANKNNVYVYYDDFESNSLGAVPSGWSVIAGNATVESDEGDKALRMHSASANTRINLIKNISPTERDVLVEADCKIDTSVTTNGYCGVGSRFSGTSAANETGYMGEIRYNTNQSLTQKYVSGAWTGIGSLNEAVTRGVYYRVRLTTVDTAIKMYRDGTLKTNNTDTGISGANMLGIDAFNSATGVYEFLDNYMARRFVESEPTAAAASEEKILSGTAYTDEGVTNVGAGKTVRLIKNGADAGSATTNASGAYSIAAVVNAGDAILVYIDNDATYKGTTVTVSNGGTLAALDIYATHLITRHDNSGALTNGNISTAKGVYSDADILCSVAGGNLTVSGAGTELYVPAGHGFTPGGGVTTPNAESKGTFNGGSGNITITGTLIVSGGAFTATSGSTSIGGDFTISAGSFAHNSGTITLVDLSKTVSIGSEVLNNVHINMASNRNVTITGTVTASGNLTITEHGLIQTGTIAVAGNVTTTDTTTGSIPSGTLLLNGSGAQLLSASGGSGQVPNLVINKPAGTLTIQDTIMVTGGTFTRTAGTVDASTSTVSFLLQSKSVDASGMSFNNVVINLQSNHNFTVTGTMDVNGALTLTEVNEIRTGTIAVAGNVVTTDTTVGGSNSSTGTLLFDGGGAQLFSASGAFGAVPNVSINKAGGTLTLQDTIIVQGGTGWTHTAGTVNAGTSTVEFQVYSKTLDASGMAFNNINVNIASNHNITVTGTLDINGNLTITQVSNINSGTITVAGNLTSTDTVVGGTTIISLDGTGAQSINAGGTDLPNGTLTINKAAGTATLVGNLALNGVGQDITVNAGVLDLAGYNLALTGAGDVLTVANGGTLQLQGGETITATTKTFNAGSTVIYNGGGTYASLAAGNTYSNLTFNNATGAWTHTGALTANNLTITAGSLTSAGQNVNVAGNFSNAGTYVSGSNTFTFNGTNQAISGNTSFNNFVKSVTSAETLTFAAGSTTTINGTATLNGASGQLLSLRSSTPGTRWNFSLSSSATKAISYVDVRDSDASGSAAARLPINPPNSTDSSNNVSWFAITLTGTVYSDEGITTIGAGKTVRLLKNGASLGTAATDAAGAFGFNADLAAGDALLLYIDGNDGTTTDATTITVSPGALSNLDLYVDHLITRHDNAGTLTNALMSTAKGAYADTEILSSVASGNLTVSGAGTELYIPAGHSYAPGGNITTPAMKSLGTFNGGAGTISINGSLTIAGGAYTATSGTTTILGNFTGSAGTFTHNSGTIVFNNSNHAINSGIMVFNNVTINANSFTTTITGTMTVAGNLAIASEPTINGGTIEVAGNVVTTAVNISGNATVLINGTGAQNLMVNGAGGTGWTPGISINKPSGTLTIQDVISIRGGGWTHTAGTVNAGTSTVIFGNASSTINPGTMSFNNVSFTGTSVTYTITGTVDLTGNLVLSNQPNLNGSTITVAGDITSTATGGGGTTAISLDGSGAQTINATRLPNGGVTINKPAGVATLAAGVTLNAGALTVSSGTFDLAGFNLTVPGALTVSNGATLRLQGGETVTTPTRNFNAGSTVVYNGGATYASLAAGNSYSDVVFNNASGSWTHTGPLTVRNLTLTAGTLVSAGQNVTASGNWSNSGTYTSGANTVTFNGTNQSISGNTVFNNFTKSVTSADTLTFAAGSTTTINGTATLNGASGQLLSLRSSTPGTRWNVTLTSSAAKAISYVDVQDSDASGSAAALLSINPPNSTDSGNNLSWFTLTGTVYSDEGITHIGAGKTVRLLKNGVSMGTVVTNAVGVFSFDVTATTGDALLLYIDGDDGATTDATTITVSPGGASSNLNLYVGHLITRHDNTGALTNALMSTAKGAYADTEILMAVAAGNLTVSGTGTVLYIPAGHSYAPGGNITTPAMKSLGTFNGGAGAVAINGSLTVAGGAYTATSGTTTVQGDLTISGGTFTHNSGTVALTSLGKTVDIGAASLYDVTLNIGGQSMGVTGIMTVARNFTITSVSTISGGTIAVAGNVTSTASGAGGTATILFNGTGAQTLNAAGGTGAVPAVSINKPSGTLTLQDTIMLNGSAGWTYTAGTVDPGTSTVVFKGPGITVNAGPTSFYHATIDIGGQSLGVTGTMTVGGNFTITSASSLGGTIAVAGNVTSTDLSVGGAATILFNGTGAQTLSAAGASGGVPAVSINKPSGTLTLQDTIMLGGSAGWTYTAGTVDPGTSTVVFKGPGITVNAGSTSFYHVTIDISSQSLAVTGTMTVGGDFAITSASTINGGTIAVAKNLTSTDAVVNGTASITLDGTGAQTITVAGADLPEGTFTINKPSGTATLASNMTLSGAGQDLTINSGTLDLAGYNLILTGGGDVLTVANGGTLQLQGGETITASTKTLQTGSTVIYNGSGAYGSLVMGNNYHHLIFNGSGGWAHAAPLTVNGNLTVTSGTLNSGGQNVTVAGNWSNSGTYTSGANTVTFNGTNQSISGNTTFNHFTKTVTSTDTLTFAAGSTTSVAAGGKLTLAGASGNLLRLRSGTPGMEWFLNVGAGVAPAANYVDVQDSDAGGGQTIYAYYSTDSLGNTNWVFGQQLQLVKQVWDLAGNCLASRPADAACNGGADSVTVPAGSSVRFVIFVRNPMAVSAPDLRLQDLIDDSGFTYQAGTLRRSAVDGTAPSDTATLATLHAAATVAQTDARDGATQSDEFTGIDITASPDQLTVGGSGGAGDNDILNLPANKTFVLAFRAVKN